MNPILTGHGIRLMGLAIHLITEALQGKIGLRKPGDKNAQQRLKKKKKKKQRNDQPNEPQNYLFACKTEISHNSSYITNTCLS